jgi:hypothetical protein
MVANQADGLSLPKGGETSQASHALAEKIVARNRQKEKKQISSVSPSPSILDPWF